MLKSVKVKKSLTLSWLCKLTILLFTAALTFGCQSRQIDTELSVASAVKLYASDFEANLLANNFGSDKAAKIAGELGVMMLEFIQKAPQNIQSEWCAAQHNEKSREFTKKITQAIQDKNAEVQAGLARENREWTKAAYPRLFIYFNENSDEINLMIMRVFSRASYREFEDRFGHKTFADAQKLYRQNIEDSLLIAGKTPEEAKKAAQEVVIPLPNDLDVQNEWIRMVFDPNRLELHQKYLDSVKANLEDAQKANLKAMNEYINGNFTLLVLFLRQMDQKIRQLKQEQQAQQKLPDSVTQDLKK